MYGLTPEHIADVTGAAVLYRGTREISGEVLIDSRKVKSGDMFCAFKGEKSDGNAYLISSIESGAAAVVASDKPNSEVLACAKKAGASVFVANNYDMQEFLLVLAASYRASHPEWDVVAITGSVGKTTTKDMLVSAVSSQVAAHATAGNYNNLIGLPLTILSTPKDTQVLILEMGMNALGEIKRLSECARPSLGAITNIGTSHIGFLGTRENIARAKAELISGMCSSPRYPTPRIVLLSSDDYTEFIRKNYADPRGVQVVTVGENSDDDLQICSVDLNCAGYARVQFSCSDGVRGTATMPIPGKKIADGFSVVMALVWSLGLSRSIALENIQSMHSTSMRLEISKTPSGTTIINDCYNAAPSSMALALDVLEKTETGGKRIAVLGQMGELGDEAKRLHEFTAVYAAAKNLDCVIFVGKTYASCMAEAAVIMGMPKHHISCAHDAKDALRILAGKVLPGDAVLVKASRALGLEYVVQGVCAL